MSAKRTTDKRWYFPKLTPFWDRVDRDGECWFWLGSRNRQGYGLAHDGSRMRLAHRLAWIDAVGPIPEGMEICHSCDNPACVRPKHLYVGTHKENMAQMAAHGRSTRGERNPMAKLTSVEAVAIRGLIARGESTSVVAERFGVSRSTVNGIVAGRRWAA